VTLIATHISKYGIVQMSDSNLTAGGKLAGPGRKVFDLPFSHAALAVAGSYSVGGRDMDAWMDECIADYGNGEEPTLTGFAEHLRMRLSRELTESERARLTLIHIGGYVDDPACTHPVLLFVRNIKGMHPDGRYIGPGTRECSLSEDFWARDFVDNATTRMGMATGGWQSYFNGFPEGRIAYLGLTRAFNDFFRQLWAVPGWMFRAPTSLEEVGAFAELELRAMDALFRASNYPAPYIGGEPQVRLIPPPRNSVRF
jgi:hypothetical protein